MNIIQKYPLKLVDHQEIEVYSGAQIIYAGLDDCKTPCIWAIVNTDFMKHKIPIWIVESGKSVPKMGFSGYLGAFAKEYNMWFIFG